MIVRISFDLVVKDTRRFHPKGISQAYSDIGFILQKFDFQWVQGSLYLTGTDDLANLFGAIMALRQLPWFPKCVRDIRAFRVEQWSDFTAIAKRQD